jgi:uncharacterized membrane protein
VAVRPGQRAGYLLFGAAMGGLIDGFVLHQLLQWHHLWSSRTTVDTVAGLERNTLADGIFHSASLVVLIIGAVLIVGERVPVPAALGLVLIGWGVFHVIDQFVFHLALGAHHIREGVSNPEVYDWAFFGIGLVLIAAGWLVAWSTRRRARPARA